MLNHALQFGFTTTRAFILPERWPIKYGSPYLCEHHRCSDAAICYNSKSRMTLNVCSRIVSERDPGTKTQAHLLVISGKCSRERLWCGLCVCGGVGLVIRAKGPWVGPNPNWADAVNKSYRALYRSKQWCSLFHVYTHTSLCGIYGRERVLKG